MERNIKHTIKKDTSYYLTLTVVGWIDVFSRENYRKVLVDSLRHCIVCKGLNVYAFCIMTNHLHLIANTNEGVMLSDVIRDFKKFTSKQIVEQIQTEPESRREWMLNLFEYSAKCSKKHKQFKFWKAGTHAIELFGEKFTWNKVNYIHDNPVRAGWVNKPEEWRYSSASNYKDLDEHVLNEIICLKPFMQTVR